MTSTNQPHRRPRPRLGRRHHARVGASTRSARRRRRVRPARTLAARLRQPRRRGRPRALQSAGLGVACSRGLAFDADVSSDDAGVVARGEKLLHDSLQRDPRARRHALHRRPLQRPGQVRPPRSPTAGRRNVVAVLRGLAQEARGREMTLGLEICNRYETNVINTARDALRLADDIGADNVLIHLDTYHMNIEEDDLVTPGARCRRPARLCPHRREPPGLPRLRATSTSPRSSTRWPTSATRADHLRVVLLGRRDAPGLSNDLAIWRNLWADGEDLARHARGFIAGRLREPSAR